MNNTKFNELSEKVKRERLEAIISLVAPNLNTGGWVKSIPIEEQMKVLLANNHDLLSMARTYSITSKNYRKCLWILGDGVPGTDKYDPLFHLYEYQVVYISQTNLEHPLNPVKNYNTLLIYLGE